MCMIVYVCVCAESGISSDTRTRTHACAAHHVARERKERGWEDTEIASLSVECVACLLFSLCVCVSDYTRPGLAHRAYNSLVDFIQRFTPSLHMGRGGTRGYAEEAWDKAKGMGEYGAERLYDKAKDTAYGMKESAQDFLSAAKEKIMGPPKEYEVMASVDIIQP